MEVAVMLPSLFVVPVTRMVWPTAREDTGTLWRIVTVVDDVVVTETFVPLDSVTVSVAPLMELTEPETEPVAPRVSPEALTAVAPESLMLRAAMVDPVAVPTTTTLSPCFTSTMAPVADEAAVVDEVVLTTRVLPDAVVRLIVVPLTEAMVPAVPGPPARPGPPKPAPPVVVDVAAVVGCTVAARIARKPPRPMTAAVIPATIRVRFFGWPAAPGPGAASGSRSP
jgi:hypothetical protein